MKPFGARPQDDLSRFMPMGYLCWFGATSPKRKINDKFCMHQTSHPPGLQLLKEFMPSIQGPVVFHRYCTSLVGQNHPAGVAAGHNLGRSERRNSVGPGILLRNTDPYIARDQSLAGQDKIQLKVADHKACSHLAVGQGAQEYCLAVGDIVPVVREPGIDGRIRELGVASHKKSVGQKAPAGVTDYRKYLAAHY